MFKLKFSSKHISQVTVDEYLRNPQEGVTVQPQNYDDLRAVVWTAICIYGFGADLNFIDTSKITDMNHLFGKKHEFRESEYYKFRGDISKWDVSNVKNMYCMFYNSEFNGDISKWNVSKVTNMAVMFADSKFKGNISNWDVSNVEDMGWMFSGSYFNGDISKWNVSNVKRMESMFSGRSSFDGDISKWNVSSVENMENMFKESYFKGDISKWNVSNVTNFESMFNRCYKFNGDISSWKINPDSKTKDMFLYCPLAKKYGESGYFLKHPDSSPEEYAQIENKFEEYFEKAVESKEFQDLVKKDSVIKYVGYNNDEDIIGIVFVFENEYGNEDEIYFDFYFNIEDKRIELKIMGPSSSYDDHVKWQSYEDKLSFTFEEFKESIIYLTRQGLKYCEYTIDYRKDDGY